MKRFYNFEASHWYLSHMLRHSLNAHAQLSSWARDLVFTSFAYICDKYQNHLCKLFSAISFNSSITVEGQWLSGRVLDSRPRGCRFKPHRRHCVVSLSNTY